MGTELGQVEAIPPPVTFVFCALLQAIARQDITGLDVFDFLELLEDLSRLS